MDGADAPRATTAGALRYAMDILEQMPPVGPELRERGYATESDLVGGLDDPDARVRRGCLELLGEAWGQWSDEAPGRVAEKLGDPEWQVRYTAVHTLARQAARPDILPAAITTLHDDENRYVRMLAVELVGTAAHSDQAAARALRDVRDGDADPAVRRKAGRFAPRG